MDRFCRTGIQGVCSKQSRHGDWVCSAEDDFYGVEARGFGVGCGLVPSMRGGSARGWGIRLSSHSRCQPFIYKLLRCRVAVAQRSQSRGHRDWLPCRRVGPEVAVVAHVSYAAEMTEPNTDLRYGFTYVVVRTIDSCECEGVMMAEDKNVVTLGHFVCKCPLVSFLFG